MGEIPDDAMTGNFTKFFRTVRSLIVGVLALTIFGGTSVMLGEIALDLNKGLQRRVIAIHWYLVFTQTIASTTILVLIGSPALMIPLLRKKRLTHEHYAMIGGAMSISACSLGLSSLSLFSSPAIVVVCALVWWGGIVLASTASDD